MEFWLFWWPLSKNCIHVILILRILIESIFQNRSIFVQIITKKLFFLRTLFKIGKYFATFLSLFLSFSWRFKQGIIALLFRRLLFLSLLKFIRNIHLVSTYFRRDSAKFVFLDGEILFVVFFEEKIERKLGVIFAYHVLSEDFWVVPPTFSLLDVAFSCAQSFKDFTFLIKPIPSLDLQIEAFVLGIEKLFLYHF